MEEEMKAECQAQPCLGMLSSGVLKIWAMIPGAVSVLCLVLVLTSGFLSRVNISNFDDPSSSLAETKLSPTESSKIPQRINCKLGTKPRNTCPSNYPTRLEPNITSSGLCPEYFRWIHEDLRPWKETGITREMLEQPKARRFAHFRLVVIEGKVYLETFKKAYQTRDVFTVWGILQLLRLYPGKVPDLELMFCCDDTTVIQRRDYHPGSETAAPPPLFHYCWKSTSLDIPFPDWSFWGWPEVNIKPWEMTVREIRKKANRLKWKDRQPFAYWKGNPLTKNRADLMKCNNNEPSKRDWNVRAFSQNWGRERREGFKTSNLENQCKYRYKIYVEGRAWSVSQKYIMACNSTTLMVRPGYYEFFTRGMFPLEHYWPIRPTNKCRDIKFAVDWGNKHPSMAQKMGETGTRYMEESVKIKYVYDYMLHTLTEYAKLLRFKPEVPPGATEICPEKMACSAQGPVKRSMLDSMVASPSDSLPCTLSPPFNPVELKDMDRRKVNAIRQVETWVAEYYRKNQG